MRPQLVLVMTWLVAVAVATGIGFFAIGVVGNVVRDRGPIGLAPGELRPPTLDTTAPGPAVRETFTYEQGALTAECTGSSAVLLEYTAAAGWTVVDPETGPDEDVDVTFVRGPDRVEVEVYCNEGRPRAVLEN